MHTNPKLHELAKLWQKGTDFLGVKYAILGGAMTWVSDANLVAAISNAGGFGVLASGSMNGELLANEIIKTKMLTQKPFGVNLITLNPALQELMDTCIVHNIKHVVLAGGVPSEHAIKHLKENGCSVIAFAPALILAKRLVRLGVDALVIEGSEAGGHIGPVSTSVLAQEILPEISDQIPVFVAGGIARGEAVTLYLKMGAAGCQLGTLFVCAEESPAHEKFKQAFIRANSRDAICTTQLDPRFPVIPVRAIANGGTKKFHEFQRDVIQEYDTQKIDMKDAQLKIEHFWAGSLRRAVIDGDIENGSLMAGQSVGMVKKIQSTADIIETLIAEALSQL
jgi:enoyl-[acyl-carrier protein] reductase II